MAVKINPYLFRSLDIRGATPEFVKSQHIKPGSLKEKSAFACELTPEIAEVIGMAIAAAEKPKRVVVAHDARLTSPDLSKAIAQGLLSQGVDVDFIGLASTDKLYFAVGYYRYDIGIMTTGSHTRKELNGFKISRFAGDRVFPVATGTGIEKIKELSLSQEFIACKKGNYSEKNIDEDFKNFILNIIPKTEIASANIVFDAANGAAGKSFEAIIDALPISANKLYFNPDGNFPNHEPDPMIAENLSELSEKLMTGKADFGVAWDGDADRISFIDNDGKILTGSFIAPLLIKWAAKRHPSLKAIVTAPMSWASKDIAEKLEAEVITAKVGNSFIKIAMREHTASLGTEEANHFMFEETFFVESGILPLLAVLNLMKVEGKTFSQLISEVQKDYVISGDVNIEVHNSKKVIDQIKDYFESQGKASDLDGINIEFSDWHFCLRPSSNDPVVRLNVETKSEEKLKNEVFRITELIKKFDQ